MTSPDNAMIIKMLKRFVSGNDRSIMLARELEGAVVAFFPEDERFTELLDALASYEPSGGRYLYDERAMVDKCAAVLSSLQGDI